MVDISVVMPTWNNCARLPVTLDAVARCRVPVGASWEVILVNNNCTDDTDAVAARFAGRLPLRTIKEPRQGLSRAKNAGIAAASGALIVFGDDDIQPNEGWLDRYWRAYRTHGDGFYFGGSLIGEFEGGVPSDAALLAVMPKTATGYDRGPNPLTLARVEYFFEANWSCPAEALRRVGDFDPRLGLDASHGRRRVGEGFDLMERLNDAGMQGLYVPNNAIRHFVPRGKQTIGFLGENIWAHGVLSVHPKVKGWFVTERPWLRALLLKRPRSLWTTCVIGLILPCVAVSWLLRRLIGQKAYNEYILLHFCLGRLEGHYRLLLDKDPERTETDISP